ncbi:S1 family peptidase [Allokutzneria sp. A3M-2-11 16]|uniref:S1 family peptidase n=1 Tax=Allokutzneria sp. A3M-2-11 16 TaxID=2962043 RepID=UPI0020B720AB|nr:S1 family peptidase [Allokutzneria sp. A3M-2-11 16]MCP3800039.1 S1 family peptidase [Allokutzneria sp. A3M-2-11 16]
MKPKFAVRYVGSALLALGSAAALTLPAAAAAPGDTFASPEMLTAMQRDLGLTAAEATARATNEMKAAEAEAGLRGVLGDSFAGSHFAQGSAKLTVSVTDAAKADAVRAAGAEVRVVARSSVQLDAIKSTLDKADQHANGVSGWYVDTVNNRVVVTAKVVADGEKFVKASGADASAVTVVQSNEEPTTLYDVRGGDAYYMGGGRCSVGFSVQGGYITAGHCGRVGTATQGFNRVASGSFRGSSFPGNDYAWVGTNANWTPRGVVNRYNGGTVAVKGSTESAVGASICRSGSTTGWRCGTVQAKNQTVRYPQGTVNGMTRTNACAEPGDSGGSWLSGNQAQGVTSGGSGNCSSGGTTYFFPANPILRAYGLRLVTS